MSEKFVNSVVFILWFCGVMIIVMSLILLIVLMMGGWVLLIIDWIGEKIDLMCE